MVAPPLNSIETPIDGVIYARAFTRVVKRWSMISLDLVAIGLYWGYHTALGTQSLDLEFYLVQ